MAFRKAFCLRLKIFMKNEKYDLFEGTHKKTTNDIEHTWQTCCNLFNSVLSIRMIVVWYLYFFLGLIRARICITLTKIASAWNTDLFLPMVTPKSVCVTFESQLCSYRDSWLRLDACDREFINIDVEHDLERNDMHQKLWMRVNNTFSSYFLVNSMRFISFGRSILLNCIRILW